MKKSLTLVLLIALCSVAAHAGGLMTNTNYHIAFDRMFARGATTEIDATFSNPAGLAWGHEGWQMSLNFQKPWPKVRLLPPSFLPFSLPIKKTVGPYRR